MVFAPLPEVLANIRAGKLRGLAILGPERLSLLPDIPTLPELGIEGVQLSAWMGLFAPAVQRASRFSLRGALLQGDEARPRRAVTAIACCYFAAA